MKQTQNKQKQSFTSHLLLLIFFCCTCLHYSSAFEKIILDETFDLSGDLTNLYVGDFNQDGKADILRQEKGVWDDDRVNTAYLLLSTGNSFRKLILPEDFDLSGDLTNLYVGDFNGDGRADILRQEKGVWDDDRVNTAYLLLSTGQNFQKIILSEDFDLAGDLTNLYIGDFNGDGRDDILRQEKGVWDDDRVNTAYLLLSTGKNFKKIILSEDFDLSGDLTNLYIGDFNQDGKADILRQEKGVWDDDRVNTAYLLLSTGQNFQKIILSEDFDLAGDLTNLYIGDFNGDGRDDILRQEKGVWDDDRVNTAYLLLSTGKNFKKIILSEDFDLSGDLTNLYIGDFNGDGMDDILRQEKGVWDDRVNTAYLLLSTGQDFTKTVLPEDLDLAGDLTNLYIGDFDGDGMDDVLRQEKGVWDDDRVNTAYLLLSQEMIE